MTTRDTTDRYGRTVIKVNYGSQSWDRFSILGDPDMSQLVEVKVEGVTINMHADVADELADALRRAAIAAAQKEGV